MTKKGITIDELNKYVQHLSIKPSEEERKDLLRIMTKAKESKKGTKRSRS